jgi:hypothetical protein
VADPSRYAIIDYRAFRGLGAAKPEGANPNEYATDAEFSEHYRTYPTKPAAYEFSVEYVREIAGEADLSAREIDRALWALDKETT